MVEILRKTLVENHLQLLTELFNRYSYLAEVHLADFIVDDIWETVVPADMRVGFLSEKCDVSDEVWFQLVSAPRTSPSHDDSPIGESCSSASPRIGSLEELIRVAANCRLEVLLENKLYENDLKDVLHLSYLSLNGADSMSGEQLKFDAYTGQKKQHEVELMANLVAAICQKHNITQVIDIGSGKGYLGSLLALQHNLKVLGIDSSDSNIANASKRNARLQKSWNGFVERALVRSQKERPNKRVNDQKSLNCQPPNIKDMSSNRQSPENKPGFASGSFIGVPQLINKATDIAALLESSPLVDLAPCCILTGLHTCGNLAALILESYVKEPRFRSVVSIGCCYHLLDEEFSKNPYTSTEIVANCFPMSSFLKERKFTLGRNARMLACEALHRIISQQSTPSARLFYRAVLKVILRDKYGKKFDSVHVGRLDKKMVSFKDYVKTAMLKINAPDQLSDSEVSSYFNKYSNYEGLMKRFCRLRSLLAPAIESLIILDRLCYLNEQDNVSTSYLVCLFDPVISPRCHAIVSFKP